MRLKLRLPMYALAAALLGLIALLATLQYRWLGQVSAAERERMQSTLAARSNAFARDFDGEITRAYFMFQLDTMAGGTNLPALVAGRYDSWHATSRYPRLLKDIYIISREATGAGGIRRFNATTRFIEPSTWPDELAPVKAEMEKPEPSPQPSQPGTFVIRTMPEIVWENVPAVLVPMPMVMLNTISVMDAAPRRADVHLTPNLQFTVLLLDRDYIAGELLPALAQQHFRGAGDDIDYQVAVVSGAGRGRVYSTDPSFEPAPAVPADAAASLFQVRPQDFPEMRSEVRRFTSFVSRLPLGGTTVTRGEWEQKRGAEMREVVRGRASSSVTVRDTSPLTIMLQHSLSEAERRAVETGVVAAAGQVARPATPPAWRLVVKHPSGSLEAAVTNVRRRNLLVSSGILAVLGASVGFLIVSTRRAQDLARQQMEFVAAVSHELRTPLAVIRSAADNLADGVVNGEGQVRKYGELVRGEGRRLSDMVEQILELAGIQSGQRGFALGPVPIASLLHDVVGAHEPLIQDAALHVELDIADGLPPVLGDETALRRVFQNLVGNAVKYGATGGWLGISARSTGRELQVTVADRGMGIAPSEQENIFKPFYRAADVVAAQIQGAGLGLSLVQRIVDAHGGRISVESTPGQGSVFTVHLPSASEEPASRTSSAATPAASGARS